MDQRRRHYLQLMGVTYWEDRKSPSLSSTLPNPSQVVAEGIASDYTSQPNQITTMANSNPSGDDNNLVPSSVGKTEALDLATDGDSDSDGGGDERTRLIATLDWAALQQQVSHCTACSLHASRTQAVFGVGDRRAQWMIIGEAPGADEDRLGEPFVGRAGKLLDRMLEALGLQRNQVFIANILKSRPPKNRDPLPQEIRSCRPFLDRQMALIEPGIILAVGRIAAQSLLDTEVSIGKLRGVIHRFNNIPLIVTYHPAYLLRSPREKRKAWDDLQLARQTLASGGQPCSSP